MRIIQLQFYLLLCCGAEERFTEKSVDLGQNVTLQCEVSDKLVYWFLMKPPEPPVFILRSFSSKTLVPQYSDPALSKTFSLRYNSSLLIHNIGTNELGVYYCSQTQTGSLSDISRGIRLYIQNHSAGSCENQTCTCTMLHNQTASTPEKNSFLPIFIVSVILNCVLSVVVTVFAVNHCRKPKKTRTQSPDPGVQPHQDIANPVYTEVQHPVTTRHVRKSELNSTYALLRHPNQ